MYLYVGVSTLSLSTILIFDFGIVYFVCLRPVSCVPNVSSFSGLSILDYPFSFLKILFGQCVFCCFVVVVYLR
jgi:uncharacterized membrane protein